MGANEKAVSTAESVQGKNAENAAPDPLEGLTFKEGMDQLEEVVSHLESGDLELEESIDQYATGVSLLAALQRRLAQAQQRVDVLMGQLEAAPDDDVQDTTLLNA